MAALVWTRAEVTGDEAATLATGTGIAPGASLLRVSASARAPAAAGTGREPERADVVWLERGVYGSVASRAARVGLLERARRAARVAVVVHVEVTTEGSHLGRAAFDAPRALLRAMGMTVAEGGDRFAAAASGFVHRFFDEEALLEETRAAGLDVALRKGFTFVLREGAPAPEDAEPFATELGRVLRVVALADRARARLTPERAIAEMRARGARERVRGAVGRARLHRAIGWVDALSPGGASCYRRTLVELALDGGAAREPIVFGLDVGKTGHVAFKDREDRTFDVAFEVPPA